MRLPRPCRLRNRLSACSLTFARQGSIGEALTRDLTHRQMEAVSIIQWIVFSGASVEPEHLLSDIAIKMEWLYGNICTAKSAFQQGPEVLDAVSVNVAANILFNVVDRLMNVVFGREIVVSGVAVGEDLGAFLDLLQNLVLKCFALHVRNDLGAN